MNESIYRSPKWLRNIVDFEVNTGKDIKGEPSKKAILKEWDQRWKECDKMTFNYFYADVIAKPSSFSWYSFEKLEEIRKKCRGDMSIWDRFDKWLPGHELREREKEKKRREDEKKEREEREKLNQEKRKRSQEQEQERRKRAQEAQRVNNEIDSLYKLMIKDFSQSPYSDKISTPIVNGETAFHYIFEDNRIVKIEGNKIYWLKTIYTIPFSIKERFVELANEMIRKVKNRPGGSKNRSSSNSGSSSGSTGSSGSKDRKSNTGHPKEPLYNVLKSTIKQREEQLNKMSKNDPNRVSLENELNSAKDKLKAMKDKYKFENLESFKDYFKI